MAAVGVLSSWPAAAISRSRLSRIVRSETSRIATTPPHVRSWLVSGSVTASNQRRAPSRSLTANSIRKRSPRAARCCGHSASRQRQAGEVLRHDLRVGAAEEAVVMPGSWRRSGPRDRPRRPRRRGSRGSIRGGCAPPPGRCFCSSSATACRRSSSVRAARSSFATRSSSTLAVSSSLSVSSSSFVAWNSSLRVSTSSRPGLRLLARLEHRLVGDAQLARRARSARRWRASRRSVDDRRPLEPPLGARGRPVDRARSRVTSVSSMTRALDRRRPAGRTAGRSSG